MGAEFAARYFAVTNVLIDVEFSDLGRYFSCSGFCKVWFVDFGTATLCSNVKGQFHGIESAEFRVIVRNTPLDESLSNANARIQEGHIYEKNISGNCSHQ